MIGTERNHLWFARELGEPPIPVMLPASNVTDRVGGATNSAPASSEVARTSVKPPVMQPPPPKASVGGVSVSAPAPAKRLNLTVQNWIPGERESQSTQNIVGLVTPVVDHDEYFAVQPAKAKSVLSLQASKHPQPPAGCEIRAERLRLQLAHLPPHQSPPSQLPPYTPSVCKALSELRPPPKSERG